MANRIECIKFTYSCKRKAKHLKPMIDKYNESYKAARCIDDIVALEPLYLEIMNFINGLKADEVPVIKKMMGLAI